MHISIAGGIEAGCTELLCSLGGTGASVYSLATESQGSHPGTTKPAADGENLGNLFPAEPKPPPGPCLTKKLLLISVGEEKYQPRDVPCAVGLVLLLWDAELCGGQQSLLGKGWQPCCVPCSSWERLFQTKTHPLASYLGDQ